MGLAFEGQLLRTTEVQWTSGQTTKQRIIEMYVNTFTDTQETLNFIYLIIINKIKHRY